MSTWWDKLLGRGGRSDSASSDAVHPLKGGLGDLPAGSARKQARPFAPAEQLRAAEPAPWQRGESKTQKRVRVTIGLDFGTSSTKCSFREERDDAPWHFISFHDPVSPDGSPLFPTSVAMEGGKLWFGRDAEGRSSSSFVRGFKLCVLCSCGRGIPSCSRCVPGNPGSIILSGERFDAEDLAVLNLAMVLGEARRRLRAIWPPDTAVRLHVNAAAPLDPEQRDGLVREAFERIVHRAAFLSEGAPAPASGWEVFAARIAIEASKAEPMPTPEMRRTTVYPEAHAAMVGYVLLPESTGGLYGVADVGSGTTDVAVFWLQKSATATKAWYYQQGSRPVGMEMFDRRVAAVHGVEDGREREFRESLSPEQLAALQHCYREVLDDMYKQFRKTLWLARGRRPGYERDFGDGDLIRYRLCLVGGGFLCGPVKNRFKGVDRQEPVVGRRWEEPPEVLRIPPDSLLVTPDRRVIPMARSSTSGLLMLAFGLAHPRPEIPEWESDDQDGFDAHRYDKDFPTRPGDWIVDT